MLHSLQEFPSGVITDLVHVNSDVNLNKLSGPLTFNKSNVKLLTNYSIQFAICSELKFPEFGMGVWVGTKLIRSLCNYLLCIIWVHNKV